MSQRKHMPASLAVDSVPLKLMDVFPTMGSKNEKGPGCSGARSRHHTLGCTSSPGDAGRSLGQQQPLCSLSLSLSELALPAPSPRQLITARLRPNMAVIWPTPAPNPIIKPTCLNIYHWHGLFQFLKDMSMSRCSECVHQDCLLLSCSAPSVRQTQLAL